jgi:hypothetical protein
MITIAGLMDAIGQWIEPTYQFQARALRSWGTSKAPEKSQPAADSSERQPRVFAVDSADDLALLDPPADLFQVPGPGGDHQGVHWHAGATRKLAGACSANRIDKVRDDGCCTAATPPGSLSNA